MKLFIACPAFDGKTHVQFALALAETSVKCLQNQIPLMYQINTSGSLLCAERNRLVKAFLESDCTHILFVDSDLGWAPDAVIAMMKKDMPFLAGIYPARQEDSFLFRPCLQENGAIVSDAEKKILKMLFIPAGFMLLQRHVLETMIAKTPELAFQPKDLSLPGGHALFNTELRDGEFWGEDYTFCRIARECGFDIWVDPFVEFDHAGRRGMLFSVLTNDPSESCNATSKRQEPEDHIEERSDRNASRQATETSCCYSSV